MHEHTAKHDVPVKGSSDRTFGLVFAAVFLIIALYPLAGGGAVRGWALAVAGAFGVLAVFLPASLGHANRAWTRFGMLLHAIVSPVALGVLFYLVVTPTGILMRLFGKDPLRLQMDPSAETYWITRDPPGPTGDSLDNQF